MGLNESFGAGMESSAEAMLVVLSVHPNIAREYAVSVSSAFFIAIWVLRQTFRVKKAAQGDYVMD